jgi:hypothetical protein
VAAMESWWLLLISRSSRDSATTGFGQRGPVGEGASEVRMKDWPVRSPMSASDLEADPSAPGAGAHLRGPGALFPDNGSDHPRVGGEESLMRTTAQGLDGSPPRRRGGAMGEVLHSRTCA